MGFRNGDRLGKDGNGLSEPLGVGINRGRKGVGSHVGNSMPLNEEPTDFLDSRKRLYEIKSVQRELDAVRSVCRSLDAECGIRDSNQWIFDEEPHQSSEDAANLQVHNLICCTHLKNAHCRPSRCSCSGKVCPPWLMPGLPHSATVASTSVAGSLSSGEAAPPPPRLRTPPRPAPAAPSH
jgi:hypothetical protein